MTFLDPYFENILADETGFPSYGADAGSTTHCRSRYQIRLATGDTYNNPVYDSGWLDTDLLSHTVPAGTLEEGRAYCGRTGHQLCDGTEAWSEEECWNQSCYPPPCAVEPALLRIELWTDIVANGGARIAFINDYIEVEKIQEVNGREELTILLPRYSDGQYWERIKARRVVRLYYEDDTWSEWRIRDVSEARDASDKLTGELICESIMYDLRDHTLGLTQIDGNVFHAFGLFQMLVIDHVNAIAFQFPNHVPPYFKVGAVDSTERLSLDYTNSSALAMITALTEAVNGERLIWRDPADDKYKIHIVDNIGTECDPIEFRYAKNNRAINHRVETNELATRIYPMGGELDGLRLSIAEARWAIDIDNITVSGNDAIVPLFDFPILIDDQLNGFYAENRRDDTRWLVVDSDYATQSVTLQGAAGYAFATTDEITFRVDAAGTKLTYLQNPETAGIGPTATGGEYGIIAPPQDPVDIPFTDNLGANPFFSIWEQADDLTEEARDWFTIGTGTYQRVQDKIYVQNGVYSALVNAPVEGDGIQMGLVAVFPKDNAHTPGGGRYYSAQSLLFVVSGAVQMEMVVQTADGQTLIIPDPAGAEDKLAFTTRTGVWDHGLGIGGIDGLELNAEYIGLRFTAYDVATNGPAVFYLDSVMLTNTPGGVDVFSEGLSSNSLWREGLLMLARRSEPREIYDVDVADLNRLDPSNHPFDEISMGASCTVVDQNNPMSILGDTRIKVVTRDLVRNGVTEVQLETKNELLTRFLSDIRRQEIGNRRSIGPGGGGFVPQDPLPPEPPDIPPIFNCTGGLSSPTVLAYDSDNLVLQRPDWNIFAWKHNQCVQNASATRFTMDIYRKVFDVNTGELIASTQIATGRDPRFNAYCCPNPFISNDDRCLDPNDTPAGQCTGANAASDANTDALVGSIADTELLRVSASPVQRIVYEGQLKDEGVIIQTLTQEIRGNYNWDDDNQLPPPTCVGSIGPALSVVVTGAVGSLGEIKIEWSHNDCVELNDGSRFLVDVQYRVEDIQGSTPVEIVPWTNVVLARDPRLESDGFNNEINFGGYLHSGGDLPTYFGLAPNYKVAYRATLKDNATPVETIGSNSEYHVLGTWDFNE